ncbi:hypothetical protein U27_00493 [Candidatus Vecturithrix granuli]|uniref:Zinc ribbon domain-containing protein n=1 Tax=Vecturithrix granuli TaxID=1499967 RepID=A0A081C7P1_VECG1|nr:hypothetical protein U27_00493 [Candidatus Vecturithrix granuli]
MTIRTYFNLRKKRILMVLFGCAVTAIVSALLSVRYEFLFLFTLSGVATAIVVMYCAVIFGFRCPKCRGQWGYLAMYSGKTFSIRKDLKYCPYCGADLDKEI